MDMREARAMVKALRDTEAKAPDGLSEGVLAGVGLIDSWTEIDGPIGPLFVAWSETTGITCGSVTSGEGFFLSRDRYEPSS